MSSTGTRRGPTQPPRKPGATNGRPGRRPAPRKRQNPILRAIKRFFQWVAVVVLVIVAVLIGAVAIALWHMPNEITDIESYNPAQRTLIYSSDGVLMANLFHENRQVVPIDQIPDVVQQATISIEDRRFYSNVGVDFRGIGRALWRDVRGGRHEEGASTITQQLVRNMRIGGVGTEKTVGRKIKEALYAIQIERNYSKQQILELYLNQVYYGSGSYGIQAAAETYFNEPASKLTLPQAALLAGLPNSPTYDSPYQHPEHAITRRNIVLHTMLESKYVTEQQYEDAKASPLGLAFTTSPQAKSHVFHAPFFVDYVTKELDAKFGSDFIDRGGVKVYTTLNLQMQDDAEKDVEQQIEAMSYAGATQAALVAMDPETGYIKAMVGGVDYAKSQFNIAADGRRQPGSSFKPIIYTAAIDSGLITENTPILDSPVSFPSGDGGIWSPKNDDHYFRGWVTAKRAMAESINVPAVKVLERVHPATAIRYAQIMGVHSPLAPYLTLALGASAVTPLEMATVYSVIATGGDRPAPTGIRLVTDEKDNIIYDGVPEVETTPISKDALTQVSDMLRAVVTEGTAAGSFGDNNPPDAHGKTGTTQNHLDVWFDGYAKGLVCTVWAGHPSKDPATGRPIYGIPMTHEAFGATICTPIWKKFMVAALPIAVAEEAKEKAAHDAANPVPKPPPDAIPDTTGTEGDDNDASSDNNQSGITPVADMVPVWIDNSTGKRVQPNSPNAHVEQFAKGQEPDFPPPPADTTAPDTTTAPGDMTNAALPPRSQTNSTITVAICTESGELANQWCPETIDKTYKLGTQPTKVCTIHQAPTLGH